MKKKKSLKLCECYLRWKKKCCDKDKARIRGGKTAVEKGCCMDNQKGLLCWSNMWAEKVKEDKMHSFLEKTGREDQIRSDQSFSRVRLFATPWIAARQASLSNTNSRSSLRLTAGKIATTKLQSGSMPLLF